MTGERVRAAVLREPGRLAIESFDRPELRGDDALLRVEAVGLCGSDLARFEGSRGSLPPMILGHEIAGRIEKIGPDAAARWDINVGDLVVLDEALPCGVCRLCAAGRHRLCARSGLRYGTTPVETAPGLWGGFAELLYLHPSTRLHRVPDAVAADVATLSIPLSNGYGWLVDGGSFIPGDHVIVLGPGLHGICTALVAARLGAGSVTLVGRAGDERRLAYAERFGVRTLDVGAGPHLVDLLRPSYDDGADIVVDLVPGPQSGLADDVALLGRGGRLVLAGVKKQDTAVSLPILDVLSHEISVRGVWARPDWAVDRALAELAADRALGELVEARHPLAEAGEALRAMTGTDLPLHAVVVPQTER